MNTMPMPVSEEDLSRQLGVSMNTLYRLRDSGKLNFTRVGKRVFYTQAHIEAYLKQSDTMLRRKVKR